MEEDNLILSSVDQDHEEDVREFVKDLMYDCADAEASSVKVKERR